MNNDSCFYAFVMGLLLGSVILMLTVGSVSNSYHSMAKVAVKECEKSLPRDQTCKVIAVPVAKEK